MKTEKSKVVAAKENYVILNRAYLPKKKKKLKKKNIKEDSGWFLSIKFVNSRYTLFQLNV